MSLRLLSMMFIALTLSGCLTSREPVFGRSDVIFPLPKQIALVEIDRKGNPVRGVLGADGYVFTRDGTGYKGYLPVVDDHYVSHVSFFKYAKNGYYAQTKGKGSNYHYGVISFSDRAKVLNTYYIKNSLKFNKRAKALGIRTSVKNKSELRETMREALAGKYFKLWKSFRVFHLPGERRAYADFLECYSRCS